MAFSDPVVYEAWLRATGRCECRSLACGHPGRCNQWLRINERDKQGEGAWRAYPKTPEGSDTADNCEILCRQCAAKRTHEQK